MRLMGAAMGGPCASLSTWLGDADSAIIHKTNVRSRQGIPSPAMMNLNLTTEGDSWMTFPQVDVCRGADLVRLSHPMHA